MCKTLSFVPVYGTAIDLVENIVMVEWRWREVSAPRMAGILDVFDALQSVTLILDWEKDALDGVQLKEMAEKGLHRIAPRPWRIQYVNRQGPCPIHHQQLRELQELGDELITIGQWVGRSSEGCLTLSKQDHRLVYVGLQIATIKSRSVSHFASIPTSHFNVGCYPMFAQERENRKHLESRFQTTDWASLVCLLCAYQILRRKLVRIHSPTSSACWALFRYPL